LAISKLITSSKQLTTSNCCKTIKGVWFCYTTNSLYTNAKVSVVLVLLKASFLPDADDLGDAWNPPHY
jgi:hypothetical protein